MAGWNLLSKSISPLPIAKEEKLPDGATVRHSAFRDAEQRYARIVESGATLPWSEMRGYLEDRIAGKAARRPAPRKLAK